MASNIKWLLLPLGIIILMLVSCLSDNWTETPREILDSEPAAHFAAIAKVADLNGQICHIEGTTHSMAPTIEIGWWLATVKTPYDQLKVGDIVTYYPKWAGGKLVCHRLVLKDKDGFIASGDNNAHSEAFERVTVANYQMKVAFIYGFK